MTIADALDFIDEWVEQNKTDENGKPKNSKSGSRKAGQDDFDNF